MNPNLDDRTADKINQIKTLCNHYGIELEFVIPGMGVRNSSFNVLPVSGTDTFDGLLAQLADFISKYGEALLLKAYWNAALTTTPAT